MTESEIKNQAETLLPTEWGDFLVSVFSNDPNDHMPHVSLQHPDIDKSKPVVMRIHSECMTGDIFHSLKCDCKDQLHAGMNAIKEHKGILIYLRQEGRGIGIINKIKAYKHQENGLDTIDANEVLGLEADYREYDIAAKILRQKGITHVRLLTNNPNKIEGLETNGITVTERIPIIIEANETNQSYLNVKQEKMGHLLIK